MAIIIYGAGGHGRLLLEMMERGGVGPIAGFVDEDPSLHGTKVEGIPVLGSPERLPMLIRALHIHRAVLGVGDNAARRRMAEHARSLSLRLLKVIHPSATIAVSSVVGEGSVVLAGAIIGSHAKVGECNIINTRASVDHDCQTGDYVHVAPAATLCGNVSVCDGAFIGAGATIIPELCIGDESIVGAGATVIRDVASHTTVVGCPARVIATRVAGRGDLVIE
jgi:sugar O-acyltransferase (sialic acid O-acetyltransferase NeuD family)